MSTLSKRIFHNQDHYITSPYGKRTSFRTSSGWTSSVHNGVDYGTNGKKIPQYAIADGRILSCGIDYPYGGAKYVWVEYPSLGVKMMHYHLDSIAVKAGQAVTANTKLGNTGTTGRSTGVHLHLGVKKLSGGSWIDPEAWSRNVLDKKKEQKETKKPETKKYTQGDYRVTADVLNVRKGAGTKYGKKKFSEFTPNAQAQIKKHNNGKAVDGYVKGVGCTVSEVKGSWGKTPSGWICLDYCKKI